MSSKRERSRARDHHKAERLAFIDQELFWAGEITRRAIEEAFGVSEETAKADLRAYRRHRLDLKPDRRDNIYRVPIDFVPSLSNPAPEAYLDRLARRRAATVPIATVPDVDRRPIDPTVLQSVVRAIRDVAEIDIFYRSPRAAAATRYRIFPHALLHDGFRWSVRCYIRRDHQGHWGEMVLDRIEDVMAQSSPADPSLIGADKEWQTIIELELVPHPGLDPAATSLIEEQYGMRGGFKVVLVRQCMLAYFLKRYQLEEPITLKAPHQGPLHLRNRAMATELMPPGMRVPLGDTCAAAPHLMRRLLQLFPGVPEQQILEEALRCFLASKTENFDSTLPTTPSETTANSFGTQSDRVVSTNSELVLHFD
jgi:hypothetical protein